LAGRDIRLFFYTIDLSKARRFVAEIEHCHVLTPSEAEDAYGVFEHNGTITRMIKDVQAINGDTAVLSNKAQFQNWALNLFNVRYRPHHLTRYSEPILVPGENRVWKYARYQLIHANEERIDEWLRDVRSRGTDHPILAGA
jgi:hypothetical protein